MVIIKHLAFTIFFLLALIGIVSFSVFLHELYHFYDLKDVTIPGDICFMNLPTENLTILRLFDSWTGIYNYKLNNSKLEEFKEAEKYAEFKAYSVQIIFASIMAICMMIVLNERVKNTLEDYFREKGNL